MSARAWFVTGTDTEIGKTFVSCALLHAARNAGFSALGMKPIAAGAEAQADGTRSNEDVRALTAAASFAGDPALVNPYCFLSPVAPHIAAQEEGVAIEFARIRTACEALRRQAEIVIVEGVGGFRVPLDAHRDTADLALELGLPVILVVGMRLGCINHALLTAEAIQARGLKLAGWVANRIDPLMLRFDENLATLQARLDAPLLGATPHATPMDAARTLRLPA